MMLKGMVVVIVRLSLKLFRSETDTENDGRFALINLLIINSIIFECLCELVRIELMCH